MTDEPRLVAEFVGSRDERAFRELYRAVTPDVFGLALRLAGGDRAEAAELVQEAWVRAIDRLDRFRAGEAWTPWLRGFVVNCWREHVRRQRGRVELDHDADPALDPPEPRELRVDPAALHAAVRALPDGYRAVLVLHDVEGYTHEEIAGLLGVTAGTSKSQLSRARARLRAALEERSPGLDAAFRAPGSHCSADEHGRDAGPRPYRRPDRAGTDRRSIALGDRPDPPPPPERNTASHGHAPEEKRDAKE